MTRLWQRRLSIPHSRTPARHVGAALLESRCAHVLTLLDTCHALNRHVYEEPPGEQPMCAAQNRERP